jgi:transcriptional regulator with XRE-family HTH domain
MRDREFIIKLGRRIQQLRKEKNLRQEDMEDFGIAYKYYQRIESPGNNPANITMRTLLKIANALEVEPRDILDFEDQS